MSKEIKREGFGIGRLDEAIEGGIVNGHTVLVYGSYGVGKTILALHWANEGIRAGEKVIYVSTDMEFYDIASLAEIMGLNEFVRGLNEKRAYIIDLYYLSKIRPAKGASTPSLSITNLINAVNRACDEQLKVARRKSGWPEESIWLVIDRVTPFLVGILYRGVPEKGAIRSVYRLKRELLRKPVTSLLITHEDENGKPLALGLEHVCDGVIRMRRAKRSYIEIEKMRLTSVAKERLYYRIEKGKGIIIE